MNESDKTLIVKYITRQSTEEEDAMVKYLISTSTVHEEFYIAYYETWQKSMYYDLDAIKAEKAYTNFLALTENESSAPASSYFLWAKLSIAASVVLVCAFALYFYLSAPPLSPAAPAFTKNEIRVPRGSTRKAILPDGTEVSINAGSSLKFEEGFGATNRTIYLDGEAYFDIAENKLPFIVKTNHHTIRDIGTIFNVRAYSNDLEFETAVIEGEVSIEGRLSLNSEKSEIVSVKQQQVLRLNYAPVSVSSQASKKNPADLIEAKVQKVSISQLEVYTGWTEDLLVFENKTFQEISKMMERRYDVEIVIDDIKLRNYAYTGSFKNINKIEKALQILKETTDIDYKQEGRTIRIWRTENVNK